MNAQWYFGTCPRCRCDVRALSQHSTAVWCHSCGWARNRYIDPHTGRPPAVDGLLGVPVPAGADPEKGER